MIIDSIKNQYSFADKFRLGWFLARTKLLCKKARIIRFPFIIRGKTMIDLGNNLTTGYWCRIEAMSSTNTQTPDKKSIKISFGDNVQINDFVHISALESVRIGNNVLIASHVYISDNSHGIYNESSSASSPEVAPALRKYTTSPVEIGANTWIGEGVIVMPGAKIGNGCIIGAHSIVNSAIPDNTIAVGSPAKAIKRYNFTTQSWIKI